MANIYDQLDPPNAGNIYERLDPSETRGTVTVKPYSAQPISTGRSALIGAQQGLTAGFGDELAGLSAASGLPIGTPPIISAPIGAVRRIMGYPGAEEAYQNTRNQFRAAQTQAGSEHPYATGIGEAAGTIGSMLAPMKAVGLGTTLAGNIARSAGLGAALGATQGAGEAKELSDIPKDTLTGSVAGGLIGAAVPPIAAGISKVISPFAVPLAKQQMVNILRGEGVDLTAGQQTGNRALRYFESESGGQAAKDFAERQGEQFTKAALRRAGENAVRATPDVIDQAFDRIGNKFDALSARNNMAVDQQLVQDLGSARTSYNNVTGPSSRAPIVDNTIQDVINLSQGKTLSGQAYKRIRSDLGNKAMRLRQRDSELSRTLFDMQTALDDAMERSIQPQDRTLWYEARGQYKNLIALINAATGAGEQTAEGIITPSKLRQAVTTQNKRAYARGQGALSELARAGVSTMTPMPESGTASRLAARGLLSLLGGAVGQHEGGLEGAATGALTGVIAPRLLAQAALSAPGRQYLTNQLGTAIYPSLVQGGNVVSQALRNVLSQQNP